MKAIRKRSLDMRVTALVMDGLTSCNLHNNKTLNLFGLLLILRKMNFQGIISIFIIFSIYARSMIQLGH